MDHHPRLDKYVTQLIKRKAWQLVGQFGFTKDDYSDIEQDLVIDLLNRLPKYDASLVSFHTFATRVIEHGIADLIEKRSAAKRDYRRITVSLNEPIDDSEGEGEELGDIVGNDAYFRMTGQCSKSIADHVALKVDVAQVLQKLSPEQRLLCIELAAGRPITEIACEMGVHRDTVYARIQKIREVFVAAGFEP